MAVVFALMAARAAAALSRGPARRYHEPRDRGGAALSWPRVVELSAFERRLCRRKLLFGGRQFRASRQARRNVGRGARGGVAPSLRQQAEPPSELELRFDFSAA